MHIQHACHRGCSFARAWARTHSSAGSMVVRIKRTSNISLWWERIHSRTSHRVSHFQHIFAFVWSAHGKSQSKQVAPCHVCILVQRQMHGWCAATTAHVWRPMLRWIVSTVKFCVLSSTERSSKQIPRWVPSTSLLCVWLSALFSFSFYSLEVTSELIF